MINTDYFKGKKVAIVGIARSGLACANLLCDVGADVSITDNQDNALTRLNGKKLSSKKIKFELGRHTKEFIKGKDILVVSPGVQNNSFPVIWAGEFKIPVISEIEVGWILCPATIIAVTGSGGKTTVTTLIGKVIESAGRKAFTCGNIGNPFCLEVDKMSEKDFVSLEVSSFQLERIVNFRPKIAVILNLNQNHLDRHKDMQEYLEAKKRIFMNQDKDDYLVLNQDDKMLRDLNREAKAKVVYFSQREKVNPNYAAVMAVASILGIDKSVCLKVFNEFKGLEHRLEFVTEINGVKFINDSKATLAESTIWAIKNITAPIILIAGGKDKGVDYKAILEIAKGRIKEAILIGEARDKIKAALSSTIPLSEAGNLGEAVNKAYQKARPGDYVLLSPMCSSFDMFKDYEDRGRVFKKAVYELKER